MLHPKLALLAAFLLAPGISAQTTHFVRGDQATGSNNGSSWNDAFRGPAALQLALNAAAAGDQIFVAQGTYLPTAGSSRDATFRLRAGVALYGSFLGVESSPDERPALQDAPTVLSGDLLGNDGTTPQSLWENSFHVVRADAGDGRTVLDGFIVRAGFADGVAGLRRYGGGMLIVQGASPTVRNCAFVENRAKVAGAVHVRAASATFLDCLFEGNRAASNPGIGGALVLFQADGTRMERCLVRDNHAFGTSGCDVTESQGVEIVSCCFHGNRSEVSSAVRTDGNSQVAMRLCTIADNRTLDSQAFWAGVVAYPPSTVTSSILWGNVIAAVPPPTQAQVSNHGIVTDSIVQGGTATGQGNSAQDPLFVNPSGFAGDPLTGDYSLLSSSPAIDSGNNGSVPIGHIRDLAAGRRRVDVATVPDTGVGTAPIVDRGAYEFSTTIGDFYCFAAQNSTGRGAEISASGSVVAADNDTTLMARYVPSQTVGYFITSRTRGLVSLPGLPGGICLGGPIGRIIGPGQVVGSGSGGVLSVSLDLTQQPLPSGPVMIQPGETWHFQGWFRDVSAGGSATGLTDGLSILFE